ncbi:hypothetical protein D1872_297900 [compost metagenome]
MAWVPCLSTSTGLLAVASPWLSDSRALPSCWVSRKPTSCWRWREASRPAVMPTMSSTNRVSRSLWLATLREK